MKPIRRVIKKTTASGQPATSKFDESVNLVDQANALIDDGSKPLTPKERKHLLKLRKGGEKFIPQIAALAKAHGLELSSHPIDAMTAAMQTAQDHAQVLSRTTVLLKMIEDNLLRAHAQAWDTATLTYSMLRPLAKRDGNVAKTLAPIKAFLASGRRAETRAKAAEARAANAAAKAAKALKAAQAASDACGGAKSTLTSAASGAAPEAGIVAQSAATSTSATHGNATASS